MASWRYDADTPPAPPPNPLSSMATDLRHEADVSNKTSLGIKVVLPSLLCLL